MTALDHARKRAFPLFVAVLLLGCGRAPASARRESAPLEQPHARVVMVGDISLDNGPGEMIATGGDPFKPCAPWLANAELAVGNLECSVARGGEALDKEFTFRANPATTAVLAQHVSAVSLANNHSGDYGPDALVETFGALRAARVPFFGAGVNLEQAHAPLVVTRGGLTIALLGYDDYRPRSFEASTTRPGVAWNSEEQVLADIRRAKKLGADIVIPFLHWGWENDRQPWAPQRRQARAMLDAGATLVVGAHPHVTQGVELFRGKPVIFSLGNFVFSLLDNEQQSKAWILRLDLDRQGVARWDTVSVAIDEQGVPHPKPELASPCGKRGLERVAACTPVLETVAHGL